MIAMVSSTALASSPILVSWMVMVGGIQEGMAFMQPNLHSRNIYHHVRTFLVKGHCSTARLPNDIPCSSATSTQLGLFGNLFGDTKIEDDQKDLQENELARFSHLLSTNDNPTTKFDSLSIMISEWALLFTDEDKKMGLTTPVEVVKLNDSQLAEATTDGDDVASSSGIQLLFKKRQPAYSDKDEKKYKEQGKEDVKKEETIKEGGVEVRVEQLSNGDLQVVASRCEVEEGTLIKEMSEQTIIDSLRKAMTAWKKEQGYQ